MAEYKVFDISKFNTITDYRALVQENNVKGVIMRAGYSGKTTGNCVTDSAFETHYNNLCNLTKIGVYWVSQSINKEEVKREISYLVGLLKDKHISFPVYLDSEYQDGARQNNISKELRTELAIYFIHLLNNNGYKGGVYASEYWFKSALDAYKLNAIGASLWVAKYSSTKPSIGVEYDGWQYSSKEIVNGASGNIDVSRFYKNVANFDDTFYNINDYRFSLDRDWVYYYGGVNKPAVICHDGLSENIDYTVSYKDNIDVGTGKVIIKGINLYTGTKQLTFEIKPYMDFPNQPTIPKKAYTYKGTAIKPTVTVKGLTIDVDYTVTYSNNINVGTATIKVKGIGNYTGVTKTLEFSITPAKISSKTLKLSQTEFKYTGSAITPTATIDGLTLNTDYTIAYSNNINVGTATATATGKGNYKGTTSATFTIVVYDISKSTLKVEPNTFIYDGKEHKPSVSIDKLSYGTDYTLEIESGTNVGKYKIVAKGINNYEGSIESSYNIIAQSITSNKISLEYTSKKYTRKPIEPKVTIDGLEEGVDFVCTYSDNINPGTGKVVIEGKGNFTSSTFLEFEITYCDINTLIAKLGTPTLKSPYRVDGDFKLYTDLDAYYNNDSLTEGQDYYVIDRRTRPFDDFDLVEIEVQGLNGFSDVGDFRFRIIESEPSYDIDYTDDGVYNFGDIDLQDETAQGNYDFYSIDKPDPEIPEESTEEDVPEALAEGIELEDEDPSVVVDEQDYDFDKFSTMYLCNYDEDNGKNIDENGVADYDDQIIDIDEGIYNFGDIDIGDETAVGDYDFGDLDLGISKDTVVMDEYDYDFNVISGDYKEGYPAGKEFTLNNTPLYASAYSPALSCYRSGLYFIYSSTIVNNRIRITKLDDGVGEPVRSTGWVELKDLEMLEGFVVGEFVKVTGNIYEFANKTGNYIVKKDDIMYIEEILDLEYELPYALSSGPNAERQGFGTADMFRKMPQV